MQLRIDEVQLPAPITFNYEELKQELISKAEEYASMVYSEDQIKIAKEDRANLNRLKKALNDERIRQEKEYMKPFRLFKLQIDDVIGVIAKPIEAIDKQIKAFEEQKRQEKLEAIESIFSGIHFPIEIQSSQVMQAKWLNASVSLKQITDDLIALADCMEKDLVIIRNLADYSFEAEQAYKGSLSLAYAVSEAQRLKDMADKKAAWEAEQARRQQEAQQTAETAPKTDFTEKHEQTPYEAPKREWVAFKALLNPSEALELKRFFREKGITFTTIE